METPVTRGRQSRRRLGRAAVRVLGTFVVVGGVSLPWGSGPWCAPGDGAAAAPAVVSRETTESLFRLLLERSGRCRIDALSAEGDRMTVTLCEGAACGTAVVRAGGGCGEPVGGGLCPEPGADLTEACRALFLDAVVRLDTVSETDVNNPKDGVRRPAPTRRVAWHTRLAQGAWGLLAVLCAAVAWRSSERRRALVELAALFVVSFAVRWVLGPWGPGDVRINLMPGADYEWDFRWGHAPVALYRLLGGDPDDRTIQMFGIVLTSFVPLFLHGMVRNLGLGRPAAFAAGLAAAAMPFLIVFSSVISRVPAALFAGTAALWFAASFVRSGGVMRAAGAVVASILAVLSRPEGGVVLVVAIPLVLAVSGPAWRRWGSVAVAVGLGLAAMAYLLTTCTENLTGLFDGGPRGQLGIGAVRWSILFGPEYTPTGFLAVGAVGLVTRWRDRRAWLVLAMLAALEVAWLVTPVGGYFIGLERMAANARYQVVLIVPLVIAVALAVEWTVSLAPRRRAVVLALMVAACGATFGPAARETFVPRLPDFEYRFLRDHVASRGEQATIFHLLPPTDIGFIEPHMVRDPGGSQGPLWVALTPANCRKAANRRNAFYYDGSACAIRVANDWKFVGPRIRLLERRCDIVRQAMDEPPEALVEFPARPYSWYLYRDPTIRLALYRMAELRCDALFPEGEAEP